MTRRRLRTALADIAANRLPCLICGRPHDPVRAANAAGGVLLTWADPDDGHNYRRMSPQNYAQQVLGH